jgi:hypothetical protein
LFNWQGVLAGAAATWLLRLISFPVIRRIHARTVFAIWGAYVDPGFTGEPRLVQVSTLAPRAVEEYEPNDDGSEPKDWLLPDGAWMENVIAPLETSPDGRHVAARRDLRGSSFLLYDKQEHVRYDYAADDAPEVYGTLFSSGAGTLAGVLARAERTPLHALRGMWLEADGLPEQGERIIQKVLAPRLMLTATRIWPDDLRSAAKPFDQLFEQVRRLSLNGFATPFLCEDLDQAIASPDGMSLLVRGCVVCEEFATDGGRWYYRGPDGVWATIDTFVYNSSRSFIGHLKSVAALTATEAVFEISVMQGDAGSCWIQTAKQALPFRVPVTTAGDVVTCRVPLQKFA